MEHVGQVVVILVLIAVIVTMIKHPAWRKRKRRAEMETLASQIGWSFNPENDPTHENRFPLAIFTRGSTSAAYNTMTGSLEVGGRTVTVRMGDFTYRISSRRSGSAPNYFSYLLIETPLHKTPDVSIRREGMGDEILSAFGFPDIDFESAAFSRKFRVKCADKRFAYDLLHPQTMEFLLAESPPGIDVEKRHFCISDGRSEWGPRVFTELLPWVQRFFDLWPAHLTQRMQESGMPPPD